MNIPATIAASGAATFSRGYRYYALGLLTLVYVLSYLDRQILAILLESIKQDLNLSDTQLGFLSGMAFAIFYTLFSLPMAAWADRRNRRTIIAVVVALWSVMTALCGLAVGFLSLLVARIGVAVGEAGALPPSQSLIADFFAPGERARAMAVFFLGVPLGILTGFLIGGWINELFGWRAAFMVVGIPGIAVALLVRYTLVEPPRGHSDGLTPTAAAPPIREALSTFWRIRSYRHLAFAAALQAFVGAGSVAWIPAFFIRTHGLSSGEAGTWLALIFGIAGGIGTLIGGVLTERLGRTDARWYVGIPAIGVLGTIPFAAFVFLSDEPRTALLVYAIPVLLNAFWTGPIHAVVQNLVPVRTRAMAAAVLLFTVNLIGMGLGPQAIGIVSDLLRETAGPNSLRYALLCLIPVQAWCAFHYWRSSRTLRADLVHVH